MHIHTYICVCIYTHTQTHTHAQTHMHTHVKTPCITLKLRRGAELKKVRIKQQESSFHYQHKILKHPLSNFNDHQKIYMSESWNTKLRIV